MSLIFFMDFTEADDGKITIDGASLVKILLLVLFGIAGALTVLKLINYVIYKLYDKYCRKKIVSIELVAVSRLKSLRYNST